MTIETDLARLTAGLDRDAEIARAAGERATEWRSDGKGVAGGPFTPADPEWEIIEQGTHTIVYDEGWPLAPEARHIATFDPNRVFTQVEAIRKVIADSRDPKAYENYLSADIDHTSFMEGVEAAADLFARVLAGIYTEPEEPTDG